MTKRYLCKICTGLAGKRVYHGTKREHELIKEFEAWEKTSIENIENWGSPKNTIKKHDTNKRLRKQKA